MSKRTASDKETRESRKEHLSTLSHDSLVRKLIKCEDEVKSLKLRLESEARTRRKVEADLESMTAYKRKLEREKRLRGVQPVRLMVEYFVEQVNQPGEDGYLGDETEVETIGIASETVIALEWSVYSDNHAAFEPSGYHLRGVDSEYGEFDIPDVFAYTTPDGKRWELESEEDDDA